MTILAISVCTGALAEPAPLPNAPQDPRAETITVIQNADGSVTVPGDQIQKMADYYGAIADQNLALKNALVDARKRIQLVEKRTCS